jgi:hypothetical protein
LGSGLQGPWGALGGLVDFDLLEELGDEAWRARQPTGSPTNRPVEQFESRGLFEQFRVLNSGGRPLVVALQAGLFLDKDPRPIDDPKEDAADFLAGFSVATTSDPLITADVPLPGSEGEVPREGLISADGRWSVLIARDRCEATERDPKGWKILRNLIVTIPEKVRSVSMAGDGSRLLVLSQDGQLREWDMKKPELPSLQGPKAGMVRVLLSGDGRSAILVDPEGVLYLWDVPGDREKAKWQPRDQKVTQIALSADGRRVLFAGDQGPPSLWNTDSTSEPRTLLDIRSVVALDLSADGKRAAALEAGGGVLVWNLE